MKKSILFAMCLFGSFAHADIEAIEFINSGKTLQSTGLPSDEFSYDGESYLTHTENFPVSCKLDLTFPSADPALEEVKITQEFLVDADSKPRLALRYNNAAGEVITDLIKSDEAINAPQDLRVVGTIWASTKNATLSSPLYGPGASEGEVSFKMTEGGTFTLKRVNEVYSAKMNLNIEGFEGLSHDLKCSLVEIY